MLTCLPLPAQLVDRFGRLGDAGVQQVIINTADVHVPEAVALLVTEVMPQLRDEESGQR